MYLHPSFSSLFLCIANKLLSLSRSLSITKDFFYCVCVCVCVVLVRSVQVICNYKRCIYKLDFAERGGEEEGGDVFRPNSCKQSKSSVCECSTCKCKCAPDRTSDISYIRVCVCVFARFRRRQASLLVARCKCSQSSCRHVHCLPLFIRHTLNAHASCFSFEKQQVCALFISFCY